MMSRLLLSSPYDMRRRVVVCGLVPAASRCGRDDRGGAGGPGGGGGAGAGPLVVCVGARMERELFDASSSSNWSFGRLGEETTDLACAN